MKETDHDPYEYLMERYPGARAGQYSHAQAGSIGAGD